MKLTRSGPQSFEMEDNGESYRLSLIAKKMVFLYQEGQIIQSFTRPEEVDENSLTSYFRDDKTIYKNALFGIEGKTNKEKFVKELDRLIKEGKLEEWARAPLEHFIRTTEFPPETVRKQLIIKGYGNIGDEMDFDEPLPALVRGCAIFRKFLELMKGNYENSKNHVQLHLEYHGDLG